MHMLTVTVTMAGLAALFLFVLVSRLANKAGGGANGARVFIWFWLVATAANGIMGVMRAGISPLLELGVFLVVFTIPATAAWYAAKQLRPAR